MTLYAVLKFTHVLLAITAVGSNMTYGLWIARAARAPQHLEYVLRNVKFLDDRVANPSYGLLLVTGISMIYAGHVSWRTSWILAALVLYVVMVAVGLAGYTPTLRTQIEVLRAEGPDAPRYLRIARRARSLGIIEAVLIIAIVFLMVTKPTLWQ